MQTLHTLIRGTPVRIKLSVSWAEHWKLVTSSLCTSLSHLPAGDARDKFGDCDTLNKHSSLQLDGCDTGNGFFQVIQEVSNKKQYWTLIS